MFDEINRELEKLGKGIEISVDLPTDEEGYFDRNCPSAECQINQANQQSLCLLRLLNQCVTNSYVLLAFADMLR